MALPTLYDHYTGGGIAAGLSVDQPYFTLNNKNITLFSGAFNYYRVPQEYWRDRLRKLRGMGLNAVETYVPWNLHEPQPGVYDFGSGGSDYERLLDVEKFLRMAQEEDLFAIVRPGPYICGEWEFGGMPSWLLRDKDIRVRTSDEAFMSHVRRYFAVLLPILAKFQFTLGGPVIAFQIENEYGHTRSNRYPVDVEYLESLRCLFLRHGLVELLFTSDNPGNGNSAQMDGLLYTANFQIHYSYELRHLRRYQPKMPLMVMEFWLGWFDYWGEMHHSRSVGTTVADIEGIIKYPSSINLYLFHGGSSWGFFNGANVELESEDGEGTRHGTSSYDYGAPVSENGDYTELYFRIKELLDRLNDVRTALPKLPQLKNRVIYDAIDVTGELPLREMLRRVEPVESANLLPMELLPINNGTGQGYGYIVYQKNGIDIPSNSILKIEGRVCDNVVVLINDEIKSLIFSRKPDLKEFGFSNFKNSFLDLGEEEFPNAKLELVVENNGRNNFGKLYQFKQFKGLWQGNVSINGVNVHGWKIYPLEFRSAWTRNLRGWSEPKFGYGPVLYRSVLRIPDLSAARDTYIDMRTWRKGLVIVNGFVLSKHFRVGPQQAVFLPVPFLKQGDNEILIYEHFVPSKKIRFTDNMIYESLP